MSKPYGQWTKKQREWFEREYKRSRLDASPRGRKPLTVFAELYREREMAKLSGSHTPTYREQASKIPYKASVDIDEDVGVSEAGMTEADYKRQRFIRAYQRRQRIFSNPPKD